MSATNKTASSNELDFHALRQKISMIATEAGCEKALNFVPRPSDIFIASPPKCGTTWMQQIVHQLRTGGDMDFDVLHNEIPWLEIAHDFGVDVEKDQKVAPRAFKTHLPYNACPKGAKYIVVFRNPCAAAYSFYKFMLGTLVPENLSVEDYVFEVWLQMGNPPNAKQPWSVSFFTFLLSWLQHKNDRNVLFVFFEEMKENLENVVRAVSAFLGIDKEDNIRAAVEMSSFDFMKTNAGKFNPKNPREESSKPLILVRTGSSTEAIQALTDEIKEAIQIRWENEVTSSTGFKTYDELRHAIRKECPFKS